MTTYISQTKSGAWQVFTPNKVGCVVCKRLEFALNYVSPNNEILDFKVVYYKGYDFYKRKVGI